MKKSVLCVAVMSAIMLGGLASCGENNTSSSAATSSSASSSSISTSSSASVASHEVTITISGDTEGKYEVGGTIQVAVKLDGAFATTGSTLTASNNNVTIGTGVAGLYSVSLDAAGEVTFTAKVTSDGKEYSASETITISARDIKTCASVKELDDGTTVIVQGKVTAVSGSSAYISDSTGGIYVYSWYYNSDGTDTAISNKTWTLGQVVEVKAQVASYNGLKQLSNYSNKSRITGTYAKTITDDITYTATSLDEAGFNKLTATDAGNVYTFTATYVSGTPTTGKAVSCTFKIGTKTVTLRTDSYDKVGISTELVENREYKITTPLTWYNNNAQFAFLGQGTSIEAINVVDPTGIEVKASSSVEVGSSISLSYTLTPSGATANVTYAIESGSEYATLSGNTLKGVAIGTVKVTASYTLNGTTYTSLPLSIEVIAATDPVKINTITGEGSYYVKGIVVAKHNKGFVLADDTGAIYVHDYGNLKVSVNDYASIKGAVSSYNGALQYSYSASTVTYTKLDDDSDKPTLASATELTSSIADSFKTVGKSVSLNKLYKWTTTVAKTNNYDTFNIDGSNTVIEAQYSTFTVTEGTTYEVEGYFTGYNSQYSYANFIFTSVTAK
jgi:hypothetical protein